MIELANQAQNDTTGDRSYQGRHKAKRDKKILKTGAFLMFTNFVSASDKEL